MTPQLVSHFAADAYFSRVAPYLGKALGTHTGLSLAELGALCSNRGAFLFIDDHERPRNALVGRFENWGGSEVFNILAMGGEGHADWPEAMDTIADFCSTFGVRRIVFHGRLGWQKVFKNSRVLYQTYELQYEE